MIVSKKDKYEEWINLKRQMSRLSGYSYELVYMLNNNDHRLYGRACYNLWDINDKPFERFKEVDNDSQ